MKLLHTSDWHVGKSVRGHSRAEEHRAVFAEMATVAEAHAVDLVLVAGDLFETAAPTAEAEQIVYEALLGFTRLGVPVAVVAGNHDNARRLRAVQPLLALGRVVVVTSPTRPDDGGVRRFDTADGNVVQVAFLPFVSQRGIVRADALMGGAAFEHAQVYSERVGLLLESLTRGFSADTVNVVMAHAFVQGGAAGGGERLAHLVEEYQLQAQSFPVTANYVALGHLHRPQRVPGPTAIHYCGSPLQLDFGEEAQRKQVNVVDLEPALPAKVEPVALSSGRAMRTVVGTLDELGALAEHRTDDDWLRVVVREAPRAGLADEVRAMFGETAVDVRVDAADHDGASSRRDRRNRRPQELFTEFLAHQGVDDPRIAAMFAELLDTILLATTAHDVDP